MAIFRRFVTALLLVVATAAPLRAAQNTLTTPSSPLTMVGLAMFLNNALTTVATNYSGSTPPAVCTGGTACTYQFWLDTSTTPRVLRIYDGAQWPSVGSLDTSGHSFQVPAVETINAQTGTTYSIIDANRGQLTTQSNASASAYTLPQAGAASSFNAGWWGDFFNKGAGTQTITPTISTINGASSLVLKQNRGARIVSDGTNFQAFGYAPLTDTGSGSMVLQVAPALTGPVITGGTASALTSLGIRSSGIGAFDLTLANNDNLTAGRTLNFQTGDATRTVYVGGDIAFFAPVAIYGTFTQAGSFTTTITSTATTNSTLPAGTHTLAGLDVAQTWTGIQSFANGQFKLNGGASGSLQVTCASVCGSNSLTLPGGSTDFSATGGTSQVVKQTSFGGAFTVAQLAFSDISGTAATTQGGTGLTSYVLGDMIWASATNTLAAISGNTSSTPKYLRQTGTGAAATLPVWDSGYALTKTDDTNVTLTLGGSASTALLNAASITVGWSGTLANARLATMLTNTIKGNATAGTASPTDLSIGSCSTASSALIWTTNTGFGCNTSITASAVPAGGITGLGTGVATALGFNLGVANSVVQNGGALGTPSSGTLTNATGLPVSTGISGLGTGVATALGVALGNANAVVQNGGALGTPSSGTLTSATGLPISTGLTGAGTGVLTALGVNVGTAGSFVVNGGALGSPSSAGTLPAYTLGGTVSGGGNQINNVVIGASTPLAGSFTTLNASGNMALTGTAATLINSQAAQTSFTINNASVSASASAAFTVSSNFGSFTFAQYSTAAGGSTNLAVPADGSMNTDLPGATGGVWSIRTTNGYTTRLSVAANGQVTMPAAIASTSKTTGTVVITGGLGNSGAHFTDTLNVITMANTATTSAVCYNTGTGLLTYDGTIGTCTVSDERLKNMGPRIDGALDKLLQINGVSYTWKNLNYGSGPQIGVGAQTVERVFPELVQTGSDGYKSVDYQRLTAPIIEALRELKADNDNLRAEIHAIKRRL